ncbi:MAG: UDP-N-acetylglucosamine--N-acetylmuramyl-(pentapeptide) pyrophosphoryl-undecaprenol N-acetylglucosamine transferase [Patescibacteria group bacterium]
MKKVLICGGHFTPALALIEELEKNKNIEIVFIGRKYSVEGVNKTSVEYKEIKRKGIKFLTLTTGRLQRKFTTRTIPSLLKIPFGFFQSFLYLLVVRPNLVMSFGSYVSTPVVVSAWLLAIPVLTHEQSSIPGLANRINAIFGKTVFVAWPASTKYFKVNKEVKVVGNLIRKSVYKTDAQSPQIKKFLKDHKNIIYITGGNLGSHIINNHIFAALPLTGFSVIHQVGSINYKQDLETAKGIKAQNYLPLDYISEGDIGAVLNAAQIVIARAGANTVWELASLAKPSILVPLPIAGANEQAENAKILESAGSAVIIHQKDLTPAKLKEELHAVSINLEKYKKAARNFKKTLPADPTNLVLSEALKYLK